MCPEPPPPAPDSVVELNADDLLEDVEEDRASMLTAAQGAAHIAMLTGKHGVVSPPLTRPRARLPHAGEIEPSALPHPDDDELGRLRAFVVCVAKRDDRVAEMRARLELAHALVERRQYKGALVEAKSASEAVSHAPAAHSLQRALRLGRDSINEQLGHVSALARGAANERSRSDWLCEKARLLEARDGVTLESVSVWREALALISDHPAALYGAEVALERTGQWAELAETLGHLASLAAKTDPSAKEVAAWLHVERAVIFDRRLADTASARGALNLALELSPGIGPVRAAAVDHAVRHRDDAELGVLLETEAGLEEDRSRAARLEHDAALAFSRAGAEDARVIKVLERAAARAPSGSTLVDARVADELARRYEREGRYRDALRARKAGLSAISDDAREEIVALRSIAVVAEKALDVDAAVLALERARVLDPDDATLLADLDRLLMMAKRYEARAILWMREAARVEDPIKKADALLSSADAARAAGREAEAAKQREAAWLTAPTAPGVYDALAERLTPLAKDAAIAERITLYQHAARVTKEPDRKIHLLEKIAWLYDDVLGDTKQAMRTYEEILTLEPARLSAIVGLGSAATRAGDRRALASALLAQADVTVDFGARCDLRLRAAEALAEVEEERALALAEDLRNEPHIRARAAEVVTRLHLFGGRWERAAETLAQRAESATDASQRIALVLAEADLLMNRLKAPERALAALARLPSPLSGDAAVRAATLSALDALGSEERLRVELTALADKATSPLAKAQLLVRAAEIDEHRRRDRDAAACYERALSSQPDDPFVRDRLCRLGARHESAASTAVTSPFALALRALDTGESHSAEPLLATGARDVATLRIAERLARAAESGPQLANALAMIADVLPSGVMALRAHEGLASLVAWTLPETDEWEPWAELLALGSSDVAELDALVARAQPRALDGDAHAISASIAALSRRVELADDATEALLLHLGLARLHRRAGSVAEAGAACKRALSADARSLSAACMLAEIAAELGDDDAAITASRALAEIVSDDKARAELLRDAADLSMSRGEKRAAAELFEAALGSDPENVQVAARLAALQRERGAYADLARVLREALTRAVGEEAIIPMASELADVARLDLKDPLLAISALERIREVKTGHVASLFLLAELYIGQRVWDKALVALAEVIETTSERADKLVALVGRASIYRRILDQPKLAEVELRAALEIDPHDTRSIRGLLELGDVVVSKEERASLLGRLVVTETIPQDRLRALIDLAEARRAVGDVAGAEGALVEAAAISPDPRMLDRVRAAVGTDYETLARVLSKAVARAHELGRLIDPSWLLSLGQVELDLGRLDVATERFEEALRNDPARDDARVLLARTLGARGQHEPAAATLMPLITKSQNSQARRVDASLMRLFETSLAEAGQTSSRWLARELRAIGGDLSPPEHAELDAHFGSAAYVHDGSLSNLALRRTIMPLGLGAHPFWDVATLAASFAGKLARIGLSEQGSSTRERVKPRAAHPIRPLFDRALRVFELTDVELAVSEHVTTPTVACEDVPWIIVPSSLGDATDARALAALARPMTRIALGVPWFGALDNHDILAIVVAFARQVAHGFSALPSERIEPMVSDYELRARRAIDRRRRRMLEELEPMLDRVTPLDVESFAMAVAVTEARAALLVSGSLRLTLSAMGASDAVLDEAMRVPAPQGLNVVLDHPPSRDLVTFALSGDMAAIRRSLGAS